MYTLRIIEMERDNENERFEEVVENFELGESYALLKKGATKEFDEEMKRSYPDSTRDDIRALLCGGNGVSFFILNNSSLFNHTYFIMTESGKTFERL